MVEGKKKKLCAMKSLLAVRLCLLLAVSKVPHPTIHVKQIIRTKCGELPLIVLGDDVD